MAQMLCTEAEGTVTINIDQIRERERERETNLPSLVSWPSASVLQQESSSVRPEMRLW